MGIALLADYYMGTMVGFLNMFEITIGSALLLASGVFLLCTAVIAWFALMSEDFRLVTVVRKTVSKTKTNFLLCGVNLRHNFTVCSTDVDSSGHNFPVNIRRFHNAAGCANECRSEN